MAQFGLRDVVHNWIVHLTHLRIPLQETGAFNLFAWQAVWTVGLWLGARSATETVLFRRVPGWAVAHCRRGLPVFHRHPLRLAGPAPDIQALGLQLDKWQIGPLRVLNLIAFTVVVYWLRKYLLRLVAIEPFLTLGKASLRVFCAHIFFVFVGLALLYGDFNSDGLDQLHGLPAIALLAVTFTALILVAWDEVRKKHRGHGHSGKQKAKSKCSRRPESFCVLTSRSADARRMRRYTAAFGEAETALPGCRPSQHRAE